MIPRMSASEYDRILVHYAEIGTKGGNRPAFEARLRRNIAGALTGLGAGGVRREPGRIGLELRDQEDLEPVMARLGQIPGVAWFAPARTVESDLDAIRDAVVEMAVSHEDGTFRLDTRR